MALRAKPHRNLGGTRWLSVMSVWNLVARRLAHGYRAVHPVVQCRCQARRRTFCRVVARISNGDRNRPVWLSGWAAMSSGVPSATMRPAAVAPSGPGPISVRSLDHFQIVLDHHHVAALIDSA
jgi:hypothetical protein